MAHYTQRAKQVLTGSVMAFSLFSTVALAAPNAVIPTGEYPRLNTINFQVSSEKWISTQTAKVDIQIDASLNQKGLDTLQTQVETTLKTLANGDWRLIDFNRTQDQSGLERVQITAEARLPTAQITDIRTKTEALTKPGLKYQVANIDYTPTPADIQAAQANLRTELYQRIQAEVVLIDKTFGNQAYYVQGISFNGSGIVAPMPMMKTASFAVEANAAPAQQDTSVSQKVTMTANVTLASTIANPG